MSRFQILYDAFRAEYEKGLPAQCELEIQTTLTDLYEGEHTEFQGGQITSWRPEGSPNIFVGYISGATQIAILQVSWSVPEDGELHRRISRYSLKNPWMVEFTQYVDNYGDLFPKIMRMLTMAIIQIEKDKN